MANEPKNFPWEFPLKGCDRGFALRKQPFQSTPDAVNVRAKGAGTGRVRGGQRPGLTAWDVAAAALAAAPVRMFGSVSTVKEADAFTGVDEDNFDRADSKSPLPETLGEAWATCDWTIKDEPGDAAGQVWLNSLQIRDNQCKNPSGKRSANYRVNIAAADLSATEPYEITFNTGSSNGDIHIYFRLDNTTPNLPLDGADLCFHRNGKVWTGYFRTYTAAGTLGVPVTHLTMNTWTDAFNYPNVAMRIRVTTGTTVTVYNPVTLATVGFVVYGTSTPATPTLPAISGRRLGLGMKSGMVIDNWKVTGILVKGEPSPPKTQLVAGCNGGLYLETDGTMGAVCADAQAVIATDHSVMAAEHGGKLYIADYAKARKAGTTGTVAQTTGALTLTASNPDWTTFGIVPATDVVSLYDGVATTGVVTGVYPITSVSSASVIVSGDFSTRYGTCSYRIVKAPIVYDPAANSAILLRDTVSSGGIAPIDCKLITQWRGRLVWANSETDRKNWFMSRQDAPLDYAYGQTDEQRACAGDTGYLGKVGEAITALIPYTDDYFIFGCEQSLWMLRGDPATGSSLGILDFKANVLSGFAWCTVPGNLLFFMGTNGFYVMGPDLNARNLSNGENPRLPQDLTGVNVETNEVFLAYDGTRHAVQIFIVPRQTGTTQAWYYDIANDAFWPETYYSAHSPTALIDYRATSTTRRGVLLGCRDGKLRKFADSAKSDSGSAIASRVTYPPIALAGEGVAAVITQLQATTGSGTDAVSYAVYSGNSPQAALDATASIASGTWTGAGLKSPTHQRVRGAWHTLVLSNATAEQSWEMEGVQATAFKAGRVR